jgi:hypothetical protein
MKIELLLNGKPYGIDVEPRRTLADALRIDCGLTGTHLGCEHGVCGSCTVLVGGTRPAVWLLHPWVPDAGCRRAGARPSDRQRPATIAGAAEL